MWPNFRENFGFLNLTWEGYVFVSVQCEIFVPASVDDGMPRREELLLVATARA